MDRSQEFFPPGASSHAILACVSTGISTPVHRVFGASGGSFSTNLVRICCRAAMVEQNGIEGTTLLKERSERSEDK